MNTKTHILLLVVLCSLCITSLQATPIYVKSETDTSERSYEGPTNLKQNLPLCPNGKVYDKVTKLCTGTSTDGFGNPGAGRK